MQAEKGSVLPDYLGRGLRVVFVGTAVGDASARRRHYYSGPNNSFWSLIYEAGIVDARLKPADDFHANDFGIGLTDLIKDIHTSNDADLSDATLSSGVAPLIGKLTKFAPKVVCFNGMNAYIAFKGQRARSFGLAADNIGTSLVFVVPSTSGRVAGARKFDGKTRRQWFEQLAGIIPSICGWSS